MTAGGATDFTTGTQPDEAMFRIKGLRPLCSTPTGC